MAPPGDAKIPPAVKQVREILGSNAKNGKITAEELQGLDKTLLNKLANNMRNTLQDGPKKAYKGLKTDAERRDWLAYYCMDPAGAVTKGFNRQLNYDEQISDEATVRITKSQMAGPAYLNAASHVEICCKAGYLTSMHTSVRSLLIWGQAVRLQLDDLQEEDRSKERSRCRVEDRVVC